MKDSGIIQALKAKADSNGLLNWRDFSEVALFDPEYGYYCRKQTRVGRHYEADFYTAESLGPVFAELVLGAAAKQLGTDSLQDFHFVELGAEPGQSPFASIADESCASYQAVGPLDSLELDGSCIVIGNEVLDAQPFHRLVFQNGQWRELGVQLINDKLSECVMPEFSEAVRSAKLSLPENTLEGYRLDISLQAESLLQNILSQNWTGLLVLFDYGAFWEELITNKPAGTARAYYRHTVSDDLLARPGEQDLTCHVCWDRLETVAHNAGLEATVERQESYFVHHAESVITKHIQANAGGFSPERQTLMELLHPGHMGLKFQVMSVLKD